MVSQIYRFSQLFVKYYFVLYTLLNLLTLRKPNVLIEAYKSSHIHKLY